MVVTLFLAGWVAVGLVLLLTVAWLGFLGRLLSEEPLCEQSSCCSPESSVAQKLLSQERWLSGEALSSSQEQSKSS